MHESGITKMKPRYILWALLAIILQTQSPLQPTFAQAPQPGSDRGGPPGPGGFGGPGFFGGGGMASLVVRDEVQQELQLVDEQKDKVRTITDEARNKLRDQLRTMFTQTGNLSDEERRARFGEIRTKVEGVSAETDKQLEKVLLPHQLDRLKQIDLQSKLQQRGAQALTSGDVAKALNLTDEQREKLEKRAAEVQQELQTQIKQLQADARKKMLDVLTADQRAQLEKMMGQQFDMPDQNFGGFRGRFRGQGGRDNRGGGQPNSSQPKSDNESI
jgi:Spy/CpxP family protein refolding chaperone